jgi:ribosomal protein L35
MTTKRKRQLRGTAGFDPVDQPRVERMLRDK